MIHIKQFIRNGDRKLIMLLLRLRSNNRLTQFMRFITVLGGAVFTVGSVLFLLIVSEERLKYASEVAAVGLTGSFLVGQWIKGLVKRFRPYLVMAEIKLLGKPLKDHSFPSGHTTSIFSIMTAFAVTYPSIGGWLYGLATLVGVSRVYLGFHYPSDVAAGVILGTGFTLGTNYAFQLSSYF